MGEAFAATDLTGMQELSEDLCFALLKRPGVGILALCGVEAPVLRPVNFAMRGKEIVVRTGEGQILAAAQGMEPASFVVTAVDPFEHTGHSVVISGHLRQLAPCPTVEDLPLRPWARAPKHHFVVLTVDEISGRRIDPSQGAD